MKRRTIHLTTARWIYEGDLAGQRLARIRPARRAAARRCPSCKRSQLRAQSVALADALDADPAGAAASASLADGFDGARAVALAEEAAGRAEPDEAEKLSLLGSP